MKRRRRRRKGERGGPWESKVERKKGKGRAWEKEDGRGKKRMGVGKKGMGVGK